MHKDIILKRFIQPLKKQQERYVGVEIELPIVNLNRAPVDFSLVHEMTAYFVEARGFSRLSLDDDGFIYQAEHPETGDTLDFIIQRLGYWYKYSLKSAISLEEWEAMKVTELPEFRGRLCVGIKYAKLQPNVSLSVAARTEDDRIFIETVDWRPLRDGDSWILSFLARADVAEVAADGAGAATLAEEMRQMKLPPPILPKVGEVIAANAGFEQMIADGKLCHNGQPSLMMSATNCEHRAIGTAGGFGYQSIKEEYDVCLLESAVLAAWRCGKQKAPRVVQRASY